MRWARNAISHEYTKPGGSAVRGNIPENNWDSEEISGKSSGESRSTVILTSLRFHCDFVCFSGKWILMERFKNFNEYSNAIKWAVTQPR